MFKHLSVTHITAGLIAVLIGFTSSVIIIFQAATTAGANPTEVSSWLLSLCIGMCFTSAGLSLYYRIPILTAWSTPGAVVLISSLVGISMPEAIGAFIFSASLIILFGITGLFNKIITYIPRSLAAALLAGVLLQFGLKIFAAAQQQFFLIATLLLVYLIAKRFFPRYAILFILIFGMILAKLLGLFSLPNFHLTFSSLIFTMPKFSWSSMISVGIPLFVITMTSQNIPGVVVMKNAGYLLPTSSSITWIGISNLLLAPFGGFSLNLAAITAGICSGKEADIDPSQRYKAAICAGFIYLAVGILGASIVTLFLALPKELVLAIAGLALIDTIANSLKIAMENEEQREAALITLLVSASGITIFSFGAAFWGLIAGIIAFICLNAIKNKKLQPFKNIASIASVNPTKD